MEQLLLHLVGDYIIQNDNVGVRKKEKSTTGFLYCLWHCVTYSLPFLLITNWHAAFFIGFGHFIIDRWWCVKYLIALKNNIYKSTKKYGALVSDKNIRKLDVSNFGYIPVKPFSISFWLYTIQDNIIHLVWNYIIILILK